MEKHSNSLNPNGPIVGPERHKGKKEYMTKITDSVDILAEQETNDKA